jgi:hypothetical protein
VDSATWQAMDLAALYKRGLPPVAGGVLDQAQSFLDAADLIWADEAHWKAQLRLSETDDG